MPVLRRGVLLAALLAAGGCGREGEEPSVTLPTGEVLPAVRADTLWIEGLPEPIAARRQGAPEGFPVPFWTYVPPDWTARAAGEAVRFVPRGPLAGTAELRVEVYPEGLAEEEAFRRLDEHAARAARRHGQVALLAEEPLPEGVLRAHVLVDGEVAGEILLYRHGGRFVEVASHYPVEAGDGFVPRVAYVTAAWRWADGAPLDG